METFGISTQGTIDSITPVEREDYENLRKLLVAKLTPNEKSPLYIPFLDDLLRDLTANLEADDIKKLSSSLNTLANEKIKMAKVSITFQNEITIRKIGMEFLFEEKAEI